MLEKTIIDLWHISRVALATQEHGRYERMQYIKRELKERYSSLIDGMTWKQVWFKIEELTRVF